VLDNPALVAGRTVLDLAGSGLVAIAAAMPARAVRAVEVDPLAIAAIELNASTNGVELTAALGDILDSDASGPMSCSPAMSSTARRCPTGCSARGGPPGRADVLVRDPERAFLPRKLFVPLTTIDVPVTQALESADIKRSTVWLLPGPTRPDDQPGHHAAGA
jgi:predicted nicotinamide N-methyase